MTVFQVREKVRQCQFGLVKDKMIDLFKRIRFRRKQRSPRDDFQAHLFATRNNLFGRVPLNSHCSDEGYVRPYEIIIAEAAQLFNEMGYADTRLEDIGSRLSAAKTSVSYYFKSKDEILVSYYQNELRKIIKRAQKINKQNLTNKEKLKAYLHMLEEAAKRDHRKLGREMDLFHMQEEAPGQIFWHPNGWTIYTQLQDYMRRRQREGGYVEVNTPQVVDRKLWEASGHWEKYQEHMFIVEVDEEHAREKSVNALKPMNCPCHVQIFNVGTKSYRDLPLRMAEFGSCNRYEPSGALHGIMRVNQLDPADDAFLGDGPTIWLIPVGEGVD